jgi:hypothetical protein
MRPEGAERREKMVIMIKTLKKAPSNFTSERYRSLVGRPLFICLGKAEPNAFTDDVTCLLTEPRVRVITFARQTTQMFRVLALTLFGFLERRSRYELPFENENATAKFMMKAYHDFT